MNKSNWRNRLLAVILTVAFLAQLGISPAMAAPDDDTTETDEITLISEEENKEMRVWYNELKTKECQDQNNARVKVDSTTSFPTKMPTNNGAKKCQTILAEQG